jgi:polyphenol oxidase
LTIDHDFEWRQTDYGRALVCRALEPYAAHLFTTRDWALGSRGGSADEDWVPVAASLGVDATRLIRMHQVHGAAVVVRRAGGTPASGTRPDADIAVSNDPSLALAIQTADCVPLLMVDRQTGATAAAHAGWRGLAANVPGVTVAALAREFGSAPDNLIVAIGPSICAQRYEVDAVVRDGFERGGFSPAQLARWFLPGTRAGRWQFDGWRSSRDQLEAAGVTPAHIHVAGLCTATETDRLCSYRRDGQRAGRIAAAIRSRELTTRRLFDPM